MKGFFSHHSSDSTNQKVESTTTGKTQPTTASSLRPSAIAPPAEVHHTHETTRTHYRSVTGFISKTLRTSLELCLECCCSRSSLTEVVAATNLALDASDRHMHVENLVHDLRGDSVLRTPYIERVEDLVINRVMDLGNAILAISLLFGANAVERTLLQFTVQYFEESAVRSIIVPFFNIIVNTNNNREYIIHYLEQHTEAIISLINNIDISVITTTIYNDVGSIDLPSLIDSVAENFDHLMSITGNEVFSLITTFQNNVDQITNSFPNHPAITRSASRLEELSPQNANIWSDELNQYTEQTLGMVYEYFRTFVNSLAEETSSHNEPSSSSPSSSPSSSNSCFTAITYHTARDRTNRLNTEEYTSDGPSNTRTETVNKIIRESSQSTNISNTTAERPHRLIRETSNSTEVSDSTLEGLYWHGTFQLGEYFFSISGNEVSLSPSSKASVADSMGMDNSRRGSANSEKEPEEPMPTEASQTLTTAYRLQQNMESTRTVPGILGALDPIPEERRYSQRYDNDSESVRSSAISYLGTFSINGSETIENQHSFSTTFTNLEENAETDHINLTPASEGLYYVA